jgi:hypothetical protein
MKEWHFGIQSNTYPQHVNIPYASATSKFVPTFGVVVPKGRRFGRISREGWWDILTTRPC